MEVKNCRSENKKGLLKYFSLLCFCITKVIFQKVIFHIFFIYKTLSPNFLIIRWKGLVLDYTDISVKSINNWSKWQRGITIKIQKARLHSSIEVESRVELLLYEQTLFLSCHQLMKSSVQFGTSREYKYI